MSQVQNKSLQDVLSFLEKEYGYILPKLLDCSSVKEIVVPTKSVYHSNHNIKSVLEEDLSNYEGINLPIILYRNDKNRLMLIDGYHRLALALSKNQKDILALILE